MITALRFLAIGLQLSASRALNCSSPFTNILGVCLHVNSTGHSWCEAQAYCSSLDGELVQGGNYSVINGKTFKGMPREYWIGLTDLLNERKSNKAGWLWTSGSADPPSSALKWYSPDPGSPDKGHQDCAGGCYGTGKTCDFSCNALKALVCQPKAQPTSVVFAATFQEVSIPSGLSAVNYADKDGCYKLVMEVDFVQCSVLCVIEAKKWCVSFYHNNVNKECRLILYTDATVNVGDVQGWRKVVRK